MKRISRRGFIFGGASALALGALPCGKRLAMAQSMRRKRNLVMVFAGGGWDVSACLDPKPGIQTVDMGPGDVRMFGGLPIYTGPERPTVTRFFETFGDISAVVNGIEVRSIAHEECTKRIMTGTNNGSSPDMGAISAVANGSDLAVPYMILGNTAFAGPFAGSTGRSGLTGQLVTLLDPRAANPLTPDRANGPFNPREEEVDLIHDYLKSRADGLKAERAARGYNKARVDDMTRSLDRSQRLRALSESFGERGFQLEYQPQIDLAVKLLSEGISHSVLIEHDGEWDTHEGNHAQQAALYESLFVGLEDLTVKLDRAGLLEDTVVVVLSEMSRTPKLNDNQGKDHWRSPPRWSTAGASTAVRSLGPPTSWSSPSPWICPPDSPTRRVRT